MFNAQVIGPGSVALLTSLNANIEKLFASVDLSQARGYVMAFSGTAELGRVQPANVAAIAGGTLEELQLLHRELGLTIQQAEEEQRNIERSARLKAAEQEAESSRYDDYLREEANEVLFPRSLMTEGLIEALKARGLAREVETSVEETKGPLEALAERMGFRIVAGPGGVALRCADYPNCGCA